MPRLPFKHPGPKLPSTVVYKVEDQVFLEIIKPWTTAHYKQGLKGSSYTNKRIGEIKEDIRQSLLFIQDEYCAFCGIDLTIVLKRHREHIAPQAQYNEFIFESENLVMACEYCNDFKGTNDTIQAHQPQYSNCTFTILHPHRDNFNQFIVARYESGGFLLELIDGVTDTRAINLIDKLGLQDLRLIAERGMRIKNKLKGNTEEDDEYVRQICNVTRKGN